MRCVDRKTFLAMPAGTVFAKGVRWAFDGFAIKGESLGDDWMQTSPAWVSARDCGEVFVHLEDMIENGASFPMDDAECRDGLFEQDAVFLIFERADLEILIEKLSAAAK